ncbi:hypothetical protein HPB51_007033 [Rhipicephalus microplus]|uniref:Tick transposon n=1 Tax=Rhipicephalus microplus TaxID=6941 RepID=A0A9J6DZP0_RHIMP|nr:hypothetical protein HPB51_007033 [Rhipicephalus microplus]
MYRDILRLRLKTTGSENAWAHFSRIINRTTEFLWNHVLPGLRQSLRKKTPVPKSQVKVIGNTTLPDNIREVLELGPKFAVEPKKSAPELLGMVRQVSKQVPDAESDRCVSEGLRQSLRKKTPVPKSQVKVIGNTTLPDNIREVLELGPKFAVEPKKSAPELLGMVRQVSKQVPDAESDRCVSEATSAAADSSTPPTGRPCWAELAVA